MLCLFLVFDFMHAGLSAASADASQQMLAQVDDLDAAREKLKAERTKRK
jgi:hypothetical protein